MIKVLLFTTQGCDHCDEMKRNIASTNIELAIEEIDNDSNTDLVQKYGIRILPTMLLFNNSGIHRLNGLHTTTKIKEWINGKKEA